MNLTPRLYKCFVRPNLFTNKYINNIIRNSFDFHNKKILDFGSGIGTSSSIFTPSNYLGIDIDPKRIDYAKKIFPKYNFALFDGQTFPLSSKSVDYILIVAVLHHISSDTINRYINEFKRILKTYGKVIVIEPCYFNNSIINNTIMKYFDHGKYVRCETDYLSLFNNNEFNIEVIKKFRKIFYNELFFSAELTV